MSDNKACFEKDSWPESKKPYFATGTGPLDEWASSYMAVPRTQFASAVGVMLSLAHLLCETEKNFGSQLNATRKPEELKQNGKI